MHSFYTCETAFSHIWTLTHFGDLQHHSDSFSISTSLNSEMSCTHLHHLRTFYHMSTHHASTHLWIFDNHPHMCYMLPEPSHLRRHTSLHIPIIFQVHYIAYPNIFLHESTHMPNIRYYPHTACRIFAIPSETLGHRFCQFYSICNALICIPKYFYCIRMRIQPFSGLHSSPSNRHLSSIL